MKIRRKHIRDWKWKRGSYELARQAFPKAGFSFRCLRLQCEHKTLTLFNICNKFAAVQTLALKQQANANVLSTDWPFAHFYNFTKSRLVFRIIKNYFDSVTVHSLLMIIFLELKASWRITVRIATSASFLFCNFTSTHSFGELKLKYIVCFPVLFCLGHFLLSSFFHCNYS